MTYSRRIDRLSPALIVMLVDQSESMTETMNEGSTTKAMAVADQINALIAELIIRSTKMKGEGPRPYFYVSVIGYSTDSLGEPVVESALRGSVELQAVSTTELVATPLRIASRSGAFGGTVRSRVWVEPAGRGGTPMCAALRLADRLVSSWLAQHPDTFPPVVVNLTDGEATDGDPAIWANRIRGRSTSDGGVLLFNLSISTGHDMAVLFPSGTEHLASGYSRKLFEMSSPLPDQMIANAAGLGISVRPNARGFAFNADIKALAQFLNVGTSVGRVAL